MQSWPEYLLRPNLVQRGGGGSLQQTEQCSICSRSHLDMERRSMTENQDIH
jgi:hypothetical protein